MTEQPPGGRDVLAELDSARDYLLGLCGDDPQPGLEANKTEITSRMFHLRNVAQNTLELAAEYASGVTHEDRVRRSMGLPAGELSEIERLRAENAALKAGAR
jgi:hypothetical protein